MYIIGWIKRSPTVDLYIVLLLKRSLKFILGCGTFSRNLSLWSQGHSSFRFRCDGHCEPAVWYTFERDDQMKHTRTRINDACFELIDTRFQTVNYCQMVGHWVTNPLENWRSHFAHAHSGSLWHALRNLCWASSRNGNQILVIWCRSFLGREIKRMNQFFFSEKVTATIHTHTICISLLKQKAHPQFSIWHTGDWE